jgi:hypothetical protein
MRRSTLRILLKIILLTTLIIAGMGVSIWLSVTLPTPAMLALAAGTLSLIAGVGFWRLWGS